jgi:predicted metal-dependent hydrolase
MLGFRNPAGYNVFMDPEPAYDPRYLGGILLFNRGDYFEAHEVWEGLWMETASPDKRFYQSLIQAAVGLCHFCNGNMRGAHKLYRSSRDYMERYPSPHLGLDIAGFWQQMERCFAELLASTDPNQRFEPDDDLLPNITLEPPPASWPDANDFLEDESHEGGPA